VLDSCMNLLLDSGSGHWMAARWGKPVLRLLCHRVNECVLLEAERKVYSRRLGRFCTGGKGRICERQALWVGNKAEA
jgi:hypothetical protein